MKSFDPLEKTEDADDISGSNNCPLFLRITGMGKLGEAAYVYLNPSTTRDPQPVVNKTKSKTWIIVDTVIYIYDTMRDAAFLIDRNVNDFTSSKWKALKRNPNALEARLVGYRWGWGEPPTI